MKYTTSDLLQQAESLMKNGIHQDPITGRTFYSGYDYRALFDWDQYFEAIAQIYMGHGTLNAWNAIRIFLDRQQENGFIPRVIRLEHENDDPAIEEIHRLEQEECAKPFLAQMAVLLMHFEGKTEQTLTKQELLQLENFVAYWANEMDLGHTGLSVWRSSIMAMDNQHERAGKWQANYCAGVDLNCYLIREMDALAKLFESIANDKESAAMWHRRAEQRRDTLRQLCWNEEDGFFYDLDIQDGSRIPVAYAGAFAPLWAKVATPEQARYMVDKHLLNPERFHTEFRVPVLAASEPGYSPEPLPDDIGCSWRANVWTPTNYYIRDGLILYGYDEHAKELAEHSGHITLQQGLREYYRSTDGSGCGLTPFWGWTVLFLFMAKESYESFYPSINLYQEQDRETWSKVSWLEGQETLA